MSDHAKQLLENARFLEVRDMVGNTINALALGLGFEEGRDLIGHRDKFVGCHCGSLFDCKLCIQAGEPDSMPREYSTMSGALSYSAASTRGLIRRDCSA